jgi:hypothetical protein
MERTVALSAAKCAGCKRKAKGILYAVMTIVEGFCKIHTFIIYKDNTIILVRDLLERKRISMDE